MANPYAQAAVIAAPYTALGQQMFQGANMREAGFQKQALNNAQRGAFEGHANLYNAQAQKAQEEAGLTAQRRQYQTPEFASKIAATLNGLSTEIGDAIAGGQVPEGITPEQIQSFNRGRGAHLAQLGATGDTNGEQMVKAFANLLTQGRADRAIANPKQAGVIGQGVAAGNGDAILNNLGGNGVFNQFTGGQELNAVGKSSANAHNASAANSYASAGEHKAGAELKRSKIGQAQTVTMPDGTVVTSGIPSSKEWKYDAGSDEFVAPPTPEFPNGRRSGNISKLNAAKSLDYVISQFDYDIDGNPVVEGKTKSIIDATPQGGFMGVAGQIGKVTDSQKVKRFENLKEQLSTELRTLFRIPGEGALSDKEQAQYGIQLPSISNDKSTNAAILKDIKARTSIRQDQGSNPLIGKQNGNDPTPKPSAQDKTALLRDAKDAIARGANRSEVIKELKRMGVDGGSI